MIRIHEKTLQDIEFHSVLEQVSEFCITHLGKLESREIKPYSEIKPLLEALTYTNEYVSSFDNDNRIPNHGFDPITNELKLLRIENSFLDTKSFQKLASITITIMDLAKMLKTFEEYYPSLSELASRLELLPHLVTEVDAIIDRFGDISKTSHKNYALVSTLIWVYKSIL